MERVNAYIYKGRYCKAQKINLTYTKSSSQNLLGIFLVYLVLREFQIIQLAHTTTLNENIQFTSLEKANRNGWQVENR